MNGEELELLSDSKYRQFISAVEKALKSFEYSSEWADLISALGKLNKVLQSHTKFKVVPRKLTIGKRLAQCMHPALPSGVHLKALETYDLIFKRIGKKGLVRDLFIYSAGVLPLLGNSAMPVKPVLLSIYESYFLTLGKGLLPGLPGVVLGLLPGIEEGSEYTERTIALLEALSHSTDTSDFYSTLWGCIVSSSSVRLPAITFILLQLNKKGVENQEAIVLGGDLPVMVQAVCDCLGDSSVLVQRSVLDFILVSLPPHTNIVSTAHKVNLMSAALGVLMRRDMSLNRRLYSWILGPPNDKDVSISSTRSDVSMDEQESSADTYFELNSKSLVIEGVKSLFRQQCILGSGGKKAQRLEVLKPFRILINLLDKPEIGSPILEEVLLEVFRSLYVRCKALQENGHVLEELQRNDSLESVASANVTDVSTSNNPSKTKLVDELVKTANLLFNAFEPFFLWEYIAKLLFASKTTQNRLGSTSGEEEIDGERELSESGLSAACSEIFRLMDFILDVVTLEAEVEVQTEHWPELLRQITVQLTVRCELMSLNEVKDGICLCSKLLSKVMPSMKSFDKGRSVSVRTNESVSSEPERTAGKETNHEMNGEPDMQEWDIIDVKRRKRKNKRLKELKVAEGSNSEKLTEAKGENGSEGKADNSNCNQVGNVQGDTKEEEKLAPRKGREKIESEKHVKGQEAESEQRVVMNGKADIGERTEAQVEEELNEWGDFEDSHQAAEEKHTNNSDVQPQICSADNQPEAHVKQDVDEEVFETFGNVPQPTLIQSCAFDFQKFFAKFVEERILTQAIPPSPNKDRHQGRHRTNSDVTLHVSTDELLNEDFLAPKPPARKKRSLASSASRIKLKALLCNRTKRKKSAIVSRFPATEPRLGAEAFAAACKLLVEFSCFPVYCGADSSSGSLDKSDGAWKNLPSWFMRRALRLAPRKDFYSQKLPEWLQSLLACCFEAEEFDIQSSAVGTLLDLINLTLSVTPSGVATRPKANTAVVVIPMISQHSLELIESSVVYEEIAKSLWDRLRVDTTLYHQRVVELFLQLHNLTSVPSLCTSVIGNSLVDIQKELSLSGHWKFAVFWHVARDIEVQDSGRSPRLGEVRTLDRALFVMLDSLQNEEPGIRVLTQHWIAHALQHGDLGRIIDPLLLLLLHPATARVSIHYASFTRAKPKSERAAKSDESTPAANSEAHDALQQEEAKQEGDDAHGVIKEELKSTNDVTAKLESDVTRDGSTVDDSADEESSDSTEDEADDENTDDEEKEDPKLKVQQKSVTGQPSVKRKAHVHPLDQHKLLYHLVFDSQLTLYAFNTLMSILHNAPCQFVCAAATTSISSSSTPHQEKIKELLIRHRRSLLGKEFYGPLYDSSLSTPSRNSRLFGGPLIYLRPTSSKYLEILVSICLYFVRSEYPEHVKVTPADSEGSVQVQMASVELLTSMVWQLVDVVKESGVGFGTYISDLFSRCKVQKALLHCLISTLYDRTGLRVVSMQSSTEAVQSRASTSATPSQARTFQVKLLRLLQAIFILEDCIFVAETYASESAGAMNPPPTPTKADVPAETSSENKSNQSGQRFAAGKPLASQGMLVSAVLHGLRYDDVDMHHEWLQFVITCLPHMQHELSTWVVPVTEHLCHILDRTTRVYTKDKKSHKAGKMKVPEHGKDTKPSLSNIPPDYAITLLENLTSLCHFCLLDSTSKSPVLSLQPRAARYSTGGASTSGDANRSSSSSLQIFTNLLHAFSVQSAPVSDVASIEGPKPILEARESMLSILPTLLTTLFNVWNTWTPAAASTSVQRLPSECPLNLIGDPKTVRHHILQLLTPVAMNHTIVFLASLANVWYQRSKREGSGTGYKTPRGFAVVSEDQIIVVDIVCAIKALSLIKIIDTVKQILRQVVTNKDKSTPTQSGLEVNILQFLYEYLQRASQTQLGSVRASLMSLTKEGLQLSFPPALFMLVVILQSYVQRLPLQEDRKVRKELQDITQKLIEAVNAVAGSSLENAAWFRRGLAVIHQPDTASDQSSNIDSEISEAEPATPPPLPSSGSGTSSSNFSTQALCVLSDVLAPLLDIVFGTEEKDKMTNLLVTVMYNVTPYLKNHSPLNVPRFRACSALLASLSGYQYTRRSWKKDVTELLMDLSFFQMDITCMESWRTIINNLMTLDNTSFRDLMARVAGFSQSAAINIFANREQEMEQRAQLLKKLSFVIFCSEAEQYHSSLPEIQERLTECLRLPQAPVLHEQVFLCFRVLLLRMSPQNLTSLWPVIISEVVHVLLQMESDLSSDAKSQKQRMVISELLLGTSGSYVSYSQEKWLGLYLAACKALDLALALPGDSLPQFQMYRWAFEGEAYDLSLDDEKLSVFKPHIARLCKLLKKKTSDDVEELQRVPGRPLLTMYQIKSLEQLLPFLHCLSNKRNPTELREKVSKPKVSQGRSLLERVVERDFLEPLLAD